MPARTHTPTSHVDPFQDGGKDKEHAAQGVHASEDAHPSSCEWDPYPYSESDFAASLAARLYGIGDLDDELQVSRPRVLVARS